MHDVLVANHHGLFHSLHALPALEVVALISKTCYKAGGENSAQP
jgi:hypothetical protein